MIGGHANKMGAIPLNLFGNFMKARIKQNKETLISLEIEELEERLVNTVNEYKETSEHRHLIDIANYAFFIWLKQNSIGGASNESRT